LPKVELHLHLDCSLSYAAVSALDASVTEAEYRRCFVAPPKCTDLADMLSRAPAGFGLMQDEEALRLAVYDLFEQLGYDRVLYAEIRFAPLLHTERGLSANQVVEIVDESVTAASGESGIEARTILCTLRHFSEAESLRTARLLTEHEGGSVVGLDIAGDEAGYPIDEHIPAFRHAIEHGIHRTAHAGEARGPRSVWETLEHFEPSRIGHGVRSIEDTSLVTHLTEEGVHLEVCPTSNVQTDISTTLADHPIERLREAGVALGVNTDGRTLSDVDLTGEYGRLQGAFGWGPEELLAANLSAIGAAFAPTEVKARVADRLRAAYAAAAGKAAVASEAADSAAAGGNP
jgi:adenosine deaminase